MTARAEYIAGLRALADLMEAQPGLPIPDGGADGEFAWNVWPHAVADVPARVAELRRMLPGPASKNDPTENGGDGYAAKYYELTVPLRGVRLVISTYRDAVCERVVTGTREVTKTVPVQTEEVTVTEDVVEWRCKPLIAEVSA